MRNQNFQIQAGDDLLLVITVRASDNCTLVDLTDSSALWVLADAPGCTPRLTKTGSLSDALNGEVTVSLEPADTADLSCGTYHHELQMRDALSKTCTVMTGKARIVGDSAP
jgi:hypothetical protein